MLIHLINLDRSTLRLAQFHALNGHLAEVLRVSAVDGRTVDLPRLVRSGLVRGDILTTYSPGGIGAAISHIALWEIAISKGSPLTICEDDAIFNFSFDVQAPILMDSLRPNWDFILWGWNFDASLCFEFLPGVNSLLARFEQNRLRANCEAFQRLSLNSRAFRLMSFFGSTCYSISARGAAALKATCLPLRPLVPCRSVFESDPHVCDHTDSVGIDTAVNSVVSQLNSYVCFPPLVVTKNDWENSTIQEGT
jgi:glycosyl transferase family 25